MNAAQLSDAKLTCQVIFPPVGGADVSLKVGPLYQQIPMGCWWWGLFYGDWPTHFLYAQLRGRCSEEPLQSVHVPCTQTNNAELHWIFVYMNKGRLTL